MQRKLLRAMSARHGAGGARIVGISWRAGTPCTRGPLRSRALDELLGRDGVTFVILQRGLNKEERAKIAARKNVVFPESVTDMDELAALVLVLNLVISVPSTIMHLAKALGRPVWVLLTRSREWRLGARDAREVQKASTIETLSGAPSALPCAVRGMVARLHCPLRPMSC